MKKVALILSLFCSQFAFADAGLADAGVVVVADAGAAVADAGSSTDGGVVAVVGETVVRAIVTSADGGTNPTELEKVDVGGVVETLKQTHPKSWKWLFGIAAAVALLTSLLRQFGGMVIPFLKTDRGGAVTVLVLGISGGLVNGLASGDGVEGAIWGTMVSFMSAGGYTVLKKLIFPTDKAPAKS